MSTSKVVDNVLAFIDKAAALKGQLEVERFSDEMYANCLEMKMTSPIEHLFWVAANLMCDAEYNDVNPDIEYSPDGKHVLSSGIYIQQQHPIGSYKVDFLISQHGMGPEDILTPVVVELDGHDFHDKDKRQRSYEKARDRFLVKQGYKVLHFTGSDVVADPFKVAFEALEMVGCFVGTGRPGYDKADPLWRGRYA